MSKEIPKKVNSYNGPATERTAEDCRKEWKKLGLGGIDSLLHEQLVSAEARNAEKVTILDIGSGKEANLLHSIITDLEVAPKSREFLAKNADISLSLIGLTDAVDTDEFGNPTLTHESQADGMPAEFKNVAYTLTAKQSLEGFLKKEKVKDVDLALGTWSLAYLPPNIFGEVVKTTTEHLTPGGRFLGVGYNDNVSGIGFTYHPDKDVVHFSIKNPKLPDNLWESLLDEFPEPPASEEAITSEVKTYFKKVASAPTLSLDESDRQQLLEEVDQAEALRDLKPVANTLKAPMRTLWEHKFSEVFKPKKEEALDQIDADESIQVKRVVPNLFSMRKE